MRHDSWPGVMLTRISGRAGLSVVPLSVKKAAGFSP